MANVYEVIQDGKPVKTYLLHKTACKAVDSIRERGGKAIVVPKQNRFGVKQK